MRCGASPFPPHRASANAGRVWLSRSDWSAASAAAVTMELLIYLSVLSLGHLSPPPFVWHRGGQGWIVFIREPLVFIEAGLKTRGLKNVILSAYTTGLCCTILMHGAMLGKVCYVKSNWVMMLFGNLHASR